MKLGRFERPQGSRPMHDINVTPLVDVVLVLLLIFMLATPLMAQRLALDLPRAPASAVAPPTVAVVALYLDAQGQVRTDEQGAQPLDDDALRQRLQARLQQQPEAELQLHADRQVPYGRVVALLALVQSAGFSRMGFVADAAVPAPSADGPKP
ncbi:MAG: hypothetical protein RLZZ352_393 [Pseudomonadota bacterium]|jgi:biopolymer transport protein ExbD